MQERMSRRSYAEEFRFPQRKAYTSRLVTAKADATISRIDAVLAQNAESELEGVKSLQKRWNKALNLPEDRSGTLDNYNPVLARWGFERARSEEEKESFRNEEFNNITTALRERHNTKESRLTLTIDSEKKVRYEAFPEPYENVLERGRVYRERNGSNDLVREKAEIDGFLRIQDTLTDPQTPVGTTLMVISAPSEVADSPYMHNFIDGYQSAIDPETGDRIINYVRYASSVDTTDYVSIAQRLDPHFFERKAEREQTTGKQIPLDAWYLENPLIIPEQEGQTIDTVFQKYFAEDVGAMEEEEWQKLDKLYLPYKLYLLDQITKDAFDPEAIARAYNIMLLSSERATMHIDGEEHVIFESKNKKLHEDAYRYMATLAQRHGHEQAEEREVGCGKSAGVKIGGNNVNAMLNSVSQFGKKAPEGQEWFSCPKCSFKADGPVGNSCPGCGLTKEAYAEESGISCD